MGVLSSELGVQQGDTKGGPTIFLFNKIMCMITEDKECSHNFWYLHVDDGILWAWHCLMLILMLIFDADFQNVLLVHGHLYIILLLSLFNDVNKLNIYLHF